MIRTTLGAAILPALLGLVGCSDQGTIAAPKAAVESRRDAIQKATQSGIPGKKNVGPGGRVR